MSVLVVAHELPHGNIDDFSWELLEPYYKPVEGVSGVAKLEGVHWDVDDPWEPSDEVYDVEDKLADEFVKRARGLTKKYRVEITVKQIPVREHRRRA